ncbi:response regulator [Plantibacter cousiniae (nom. nud.)]|uniref:Two component transcriptional regulator, LuxR family n=1 Tax=Plantibacter cousiniae (nom. nud.) TaxID=199709 RepID=A0ABY1LHP2_9MICO|nr:response regulator transcription factor [Plantibacter cousiniae]SKC40674.1 two component transcriptional regulator, LuxR family [Plantibacter cousiniae]
MIGVAIVDDEALVRSGFELILGAVEDIEVVASVDGIGAVEAIRSSRPDVVLLDVRMPGRNGLDILDELQTWDDPPVVAILTTFDSDDYIARALRSGAAGFLVKDTDPEQLPMLLRSLSAGGIVLSPQVSRTLVGGFARAADREAAKRLSGLTGREQDVLAALRTGASNTEIGETLHLSRATVKDHVSAILGKLEVTTRLEAAIIAERAGVRGDEAAPR